MGNAPLSFPKMNSLAIRGGEKNDIGPGYQQIAMNVSYQNKHCPICSLILADLCPQRKNDRLKRRSLPTKLTCYAKKRTTY